MPAPSRYRATDARSHSAARSAVHGASSGTCFAILSIFICARAMVSTASGLIFGMRPL